MPAIYKHNQLKPYRFFIQIHTGQQGYIYTPISNVQDIQTLKFTQS